MIPGICLGLLLGCGAAAPQAADRETVRVTIGEVSVEAELPRTRKEFALGLGGRDALAADAGMLFVFDQPGRPAFWMKGMRFDLDLVWILEDRITGIAANVSHRDPLRQYRPAQPSNRVLEVPAGTAERLGWAAGDRVEYDPPLETRKPRRP